MSDKPMILTIDNNDGAGARDYTGALDAERPPRVVRRFNRPDEMHARLYGCGPGFVVPAAGARVILARNNGTPVFTGYASSTPEYEFLGWDERGPVYRYALRAEGDQASLSKKSLPRRPEFVQRAAGDVLKTLADELAPGAFDTSQCENAAVLPNYFPDPRLTFQEHAAELGRRARAGYRTHDGRLFFRPAGNAVHAIEESSPTFTPDALKLTPASCLLNDVTVTGQVGPAAFVKDYFCGDGATLGFYLSETPFLIPGAVIAEDEYRGATLSPELWSTAGVPGAIAVSQGKLRVSGGDGTLGATLLRFIEKAELGGALALDHGDFEFAAPANALVGGLYDGGFGLNACVAGFQLTPSGPSTQIAALINGIVAGQSLSTVPGRRYALSTRIYAAESYRMSQPFLSPSGTTGGKGNASAARIVLLAHEIDPNNAASLVTPATVLYDGWLPDVPAHCDYALINAASMQASVTYTRLARLSGAEVRSSSPLGSWHDRLEGAMSDGAECYVSNGQLRFYPASAPDASERIVVSYRAAARTIARVIDPSTIAALANGTDDGNRSFVGAVESPPPRTFEDCENAARVAIETSATPGWTGTYECWSDLLAEDLLPGEALSINVPSRTPAFTAIIREVEIEAVDLAGDHSRYRIGFATESAEPIAMSFAPAPRLQLPDAVNLVDIGSGYLPAAASAQVIDIGSTEILIDAGSEPISGGGFEVRRSDSGWGLEDDRTLINRFNYRLFSLPRLSRSQTWCLRPYDANGKYSRVSTVLHVDCAL